MNVYIIFCIHFKNAFFKIAVRIQYNIIFLGYYKGKTGNFLTVLPLISFLISKSGYTTICFNVIHSMKR